MIQTDLPRLLPEFEDVVRLFYPEYKRGDAAPACGVFVEECGGEVNAKAYAGDVRIESRTSIVARDQLEKARLTKRAAKTALYAALKKGTGKVLPWGSLTGIRPTHNAYLLMDEGKTDVARALIDEFDVEEDNARTVAAIVENQKGYLSDPATDAALYIHVPVCPSRCYYCSFVSVTADRCKVLPEYVDALCQDVADAVALAVESRLNLTSIYMGGGTPTVLTPEQLARVLAPIPRLGVEFTVEAGRPDTLCKEHLAVMRAAGVTRVSVNPQTFCDETLFRIGRKHTSADTERAFYAAKEAGFRVNMDLIAGLDGETQADFAHTLSRTLALRPDNVTVHTLCLKRGSDVHTQNVDYRAAEPIAKSMTGTAQRVLTEAGYVPYYLYRQKNMLDNLQNVGYSLPGTQCKNNIDTMEERASVIACGSGAISKRLYERGRIEREPMAKPIEIYLERFDGMIAKRRALFTKIP